jgi:Tfp pilus assembly protein PilF
MISKASAKAIGFSSRFSPLYRGKHVCQTTIFLLLFFALIVLNAGCGGDKEALRKEQQKNDAMAAQQLGHAFLIEGRYARALQELHKADTLLPDDKDIINTLGLAYWARKDYAHAEEKFKRAAELDPIFSEAWNNLGALYIDLERYDAAIVALDKALDNVFYGTSERAMTNLGWAYYKTGRSSEAIEKLKEAIEMAPSFSLAHRHMGVVLQSQGKYVQAVAHFDTVITLYATDAQTHLRRGQCLLKLEDRDGAREAFTEAWKLGAGTELGATAKTYLDLLN